MGKDTDCHGGLGFGRIEVWLHIGSTHPAVDRLSLVEWWKLIIANEAEVGANEMRWLKPTIVAPVFWTDIHPTCSI